ncbi:DUF3846 domain-containing protein [Dietzia natronolimnaea]|uniref:DUF3846 domain-containing protein n=1 Tax=Dietzia natronolimnaea TaxID=161920 RepID=UPI0015F7D0FA|nr:DUF3846 domain-containing protein [Dietzia natronolimnaea]MBB1037352.1 DUF3846 domain-containing protein [Dietzia natronolimnaea]
MGTIKALYIPADDTEEVTTVEIDQGDYLAYQRYVDGNFDVVAPASGELSFFVNDEGKLVGLPVNTRASLWLYSLDPAWENHDILMGDVLVAGGVDEDGETMGVPEAVLDAVTGHDQYKIEVQTGSDDWSTNQRRYSTYWDALRAAYDLSTRWLLVSRWKASAA